MRIRVNYEDIMGVLQAGALMRIKIGIRGRSRDKMLYALLSAFLISDLGPTE